MKTCTKCGESKPHDEYSRNRRAKGGRSERCKACVSKHYRANRVKVLARQADYYQANREQELAYQAEYRAKNPHHAWLRRYLRRARKYGFNPTVETFTRDQLVDRHGNACVHCGGPFEELDHHPVPVALGGPHSLDNCVPSCAPCNRAGARPARDNRVTA